MAAIGAFEYSIPRKITEMAIKWNYMNHKLLYLLMIGLPKETGIICNHQADCPLCWDAFNNISNLVICVSGPRNEWYLSVKCLYRDMALVNNNNSNSTMAPDHWTSQSSHLPHSVLLYVVCAAGAGPLPEDDSGSNIMTSRGAITTQIIYNSTIAPDHRTPQPLHSPLGGKFVLNS